MLAVERETKNDLSSKIRGFRQKTPEQKVVGIYVYIMFTQLSNNILSYYDVNQFHEHLKYYY